MTENDIELYWCDIGYACFGFSVQNNCIINAAPIFKWAIGKQYSDVKKWLDSRKANIIKV